MSGVWGRSFKKPLELSLDSHGMTFGLTGKQNTQREWYAEDPRQLLLHLILAIPGDNWRMG